MPPKKDENLKKLGEHLRKLAEADKMSRKGLKPTASIPNIAELIAEGEKLLGQQSTSPAVAKKESPVTPTNPYLQARLKVLNSYKEWRKKEIAEMESTGNTDNSHYAQFLIEVLQAAGDVPSDALWKAARRM